MKTTEKHIWLAIGLFVFAMLGELFKVFFQIGSTVSLATTTLVCAFTMAMSIIYYRNWLVLYFLVYLMGHLGLLFQFPQVMGVSFGLKIFGLLAPPILAIIVISRIKSNEPIWLHLVAITATLLYLIFAVLFRPVMKSMFGIFFVLISIVIIINYITKKKYDPILIAYTLQSIISVETFINSFV
ncbi:MAG: hypothetical protein SFW35_04150 [Chitinophagales bacterium]|nr:hypothetical protein [Chitinophagales bacterium]